MSDIVTKVQYSKDSRGIESFKTLIPITLARLKKMNAESEIEWDLNLEGNIVLVVK